MKYLKIIYILLLSSVIIFSEVKYIQTNSKEVGIFLGWIMAVLTLPLGVIFILALSAIGAFIPFEEWIGSGVYAQSIFLFSFWLGMSLIGYWQWFVLLPKVIDKIQMRKYSRRQSLQEQKITKLAE